jgi:hypothetical protein
MNNMDAKHVSTLEYVITGVRLHGCEKFGEHCFEANDPLLLWRPICREFVNKIGKSKGLS